MLCRNNETCVHYAVRTGKEDIVKLFLHERVNLAAYGVHLYQFAEELTLSNIAALFEGTYKVSLSLVLTHFLGHCLPTLPNFPEELVLYVSEIIRAEDSLFDSPRYYGLYIILEQF